MYCKDDAGSYYEPYGSFNIEQDGKMTEVFKIPDGTYVKNDHTKTFDFSKTFEVDKYAAIDVKIWEDDNFGDDLIGEFREGFGLITDYHHDHYGYGEDGSYLRLQFKIVVAN